MKPSIFSPLLSFSFGVHFYKQRPNRIINIQYSCVEWLIEFDFYAYSHLSFHYIYRAILVIVHKYSVAYKI